MSAAGFSAAGSSPSREEVLAASQRRLQTTLSLEDEDQIKFERERDTRQMFRRLLDPGILRGVDKKTAMSSMKTLLTIAENLLGHPHNEKFKQFKPTNTLIKKTLVDVKGALEYAVAMGFRAEVHNFQPYYVFNDRKTTELRIGALVLKEVFDREAEKEERAARDKQLAKSTAELHAKQAKLAFEDDRKRLALQDKLDRERRIAREIAAAERAAAGPSSPTHSHANYGFSADDGIQLQGGQTLSGPPPYREEYFEYDDSD